MEEQELLYDALAIEEDESLDGVSRVEELENALANIIDLWDKDMLIANPETGSFDEVAEALEHAYSILNDTEEYSN